MRCKSLPSLLLGLTLTFLAACGGDSISGNTSTNPQPAPSGTAPVSVALRDTPPAGVTVLSFEVTLTGAVLQPGNVSLLNGPIEVEIKRLEVETAFLSTVNVPAGTYNSITVTFSTPELTILNQSGVSIAGCAIGAVCELRPPLASATVSFSGSPFPLTIVAHTPVGLLLDFDLLNSIPTTLATINPTFTFSQLPAVQGTGQLEEIDDLVGRVTAKDAANNQFTLQLALGGQSLVIRVDGNTEFEDFDELNLPNSFAGVMVGQVVEVELHLLAGGVLLAKEVELEDNDNEEELEGVIVALRSPTQFDFVLLHEGTDVPGIAVGNLIRVNLLSGTRFRIDDEDLPIGGLSFNSTLDLLAGQAVQVERRALRAGTPPEIDTDRVKLKHSRFTARVRAKLNATDFTVDSLPGIFSSTQIQVRTSSETDFEDVSGVAALNVGDTVSLRGPLFRTSGDPVLVAKKVRKR